jgi:hypothetical protein
VTWEFPAAHVWQAIEAYLAVAYEGPPPAPVADRLSMLRAADEAAFYDCGAFERGHDRYALRLGNRFYPHMKLVVMAAPGGRAVFRADTHDGHVLGLVTATHRVEELMSRNSSIARAIEDAWSARGLFTWREHLREQLSAWKAAHA